MSLVALLCLYKTVGYKFYMSSSYFAYQTKQWVGRNVAGMDATELYMGTVIWDGLTPLPTKLVRRYTVHNNIIVDIYLRLYVDGP